MKTKLILLIGLMLLSFSNDFSQQLTINRIEMMPNSPTPYIMRDWKNVARGYDSIAYNLNASGTYLPLIKVQNDAVNYPGEQFYSLNSYVGTIYNNSGEAINILPSLIGATLVGIDKSNQYSYNWVKMSREFFNKKSGENVYLNSPATSTGDDWWYETMPNVFFQQLYKLYPNTIDYKNQFITLADRWLESVNAMGGSTTPWTIPNMNHRAWNLITMMPNDSDVPEPEAAGAIGYILYNAYQETNDQKYLIGAEWCMEYLNTLNSNPAYEIQLPYGVLTAARMNAEIGTTYDTPKMLNWCFDLTQLRSWNVIVGKWQAQDVSGLIGEDSDRQYAFSMNGFQQAGALVPLVKYDERFANVIGKWILNLANASRLFYSDYVDDLRQDSRIWAKEYDPKSYIAYEALLKGNTGWATATGDAKKGGWASTNLSLYSSSSVGYLAAIVDTTDIPMILQLDLNATDFYKKNNFPSYLVYNSYSEAKDVTIKIPSGTYDLYNLRGNNFIANNISNDFQISVNPLSSSTIICIPSDGIKETKNNKLFVNGLVIDYDLGLEVNLPPRIKSLSAPESTIKLGKKTNIYCTVYDRENSTINFSWSVTKGNITGSGPEIEFTPSELGEAIIKLIITDDSSQSDTSEIKINVVESINNAPQINLLKAESRKLNLGEKSKLICKASDPEEDNITINWSSKFGTFEIISDTTYWVAPLTEGVYFLTCSVDDGNGGDVIDSIKVLVRDFQKYSTPNLIAYYPFNSNVLDESGNGNNGINNGALFVNDRLNQSKSALNFDGVNDNVQIKNNSALNFQNGISISFWIKTESLTDKETYIISHGSYDNRYKISISAKKLRWTIKTNNSVNNGIIDLDSELSLKSNSLYHCVASYNGTDLEIWINGDLNGFTQWSGKLLTSSQDLMISQMLPGNVNYNFKGNIDEVRIYDNILLPSEIKKLIDIPVSVKEKKEQIPTETKLVSNYPNPFNPSTVINYLVSSPGVVKIEIYNLLGEKIKELVNEEKPIGNYVTRWEGKNENGNIVSSGIYFCILSNKSSISKLKLLLIK
ncbi:MAG: T9SS type A sorting domain-containing protein [Melioribacteraceae bacterium]|nr:T9SS type A sorting domain-containing protein [Melioribacteraceae bacterium]